MAAPLHLCQAALPVTGTPTESGVTARESIAPLSEMHSNLTNFPLKLLTSTGALDLSIM